MARAGSGVCYGYFEAVRRRPRLAGRMPRAAGWKAVIEYSRRRARKQRSTCGRAPGGDLEMMQRVKHLFDPGNLLNRGRLYRRI